MKMKFATQLIVLLYSLVIASCEPCDSLDDEVKKNCNCQSSVMQCFNLENLPDLSLLNNYNKIKDVIIEDSRIGPLDKAGFLYYSGIELLELINCEISGIGSNAFVHLLRLTTLSLRENKINSVSKEMFFGQEDLTKLDLSGNLIESLPADLLTMMPQLKKIHLSYNQKLQLDNSFFNGSIVEEVHIAHNGLTRIPMKTLSGATTLKTLNLDGNSFPSIPAGAFAGHGVLETLALDNCNISDIDDFAFEGLPKLNSLNLRHNKLKELRPEVMEPIGETLTILYLEYNNLTTIKPDVIRHDVIEHVRLGHNPWVCDCKIKWMKELDLKHRDPGNVTCAKPEEFFGNSISNVTEEMLCSWCEGCSDKSKLAYAIGIPVLILCTCLMGYYIYRLIQSRKQHSRLRKVYKYSNVYRDTVEPVQSNVPPSQRA